MRCEAPVDPAILSRVRAPFAANGAAPVDPPVIQPLNLMLDLAGEAMRTRLFIVQDEGGREACLRPDFTVAVARAHMEGGGGAGRYRYEGRAFRVAPPNAGEGHPEEFLQLGLEIFGAPSEPAADAEVLAAAWAAASGGGADDLTLTLGDVALFDALLSDLNVDPAARGRLTRAIGRPRQLEALLERGAGGGAAPKGLAGKIAALPPAQAAAAVEAAWAEKGLEPIGGRGAAEIAARLAAKARESREARLTKVQMNAIRTFLALSGDPREVLNAVSSAPAAGPAVGAAVKGWNARLAACAKAGVDLSRTRFVCGFGRAFGYYDGFLFEITRPCLPPDAPVSAGGRYDGLVESLGGRAISAVGCMVRPARAAAEVSQ